MRDQKVCEFRRKDGLRNFPNAVFASRLIEGPRSVADSPHYDIQGECPSCITGATYICEGKCHLIVSLEDKPFCGLCGVVHTEFYVIKIWPPNFANTET